MALVLADRVQQTGTANTTVSFTLSGTVTGFQSFAVIGNTNTTYYSATDASGNWEVGIGTYSTTGPTLTRTTILASSNTGAAVTFSGTVNVFVTYPSSKSINYDANGVATIGSALNYSDTGIISSFASTVAGYNQVVLQNLSNNAAASTNFNISNNAGTATTNYGEFGINSSTFTGTGSFNTAGSVYLAAGSTDLAVGTYGANAIHFVVNSGTTDAMTISSSGVVSLGTAPTFTTSIDGGATFGAFASVTALTLGYTGTGASSTHNIATGALTGAFTKTINIGTGGTTGSTTTINIGSSVTGSTIVRGSLAVGSVTANTTDGAIWASNNITAFAASDVKFKTNIKTITNAVEKVQLIGGKTFDWTDEYIQSMGGEDSYFMRKSDAGVIAQDVHKAIPELTREREDGSLAVDYPKLVALAFAAIAELKAEIDALKGK
jgi:hypothetical protein